jgi:hypothetical protein
LRFKYQNTEEEIYVNMLNHDGERLIWEQIQDNRYKVESEIKYRYEKGDQANAYEYQVNWKEFSSNPAPGEHDIFNNSKIKMKGEEYFKDFQQGDLTWFVVLSV